jgi:hypothetical protein
MKNIIFNKTESFGGRNTSNHARQIFCSKSNCETVYKHIHLKMADQCYKGMLDANVLLTKKDEILIILTGSIE